MSSERRHDLIEELVVADALDGLEDAERLELERLMAEHGPECVECRTLVAEYAEVAGRLALSLEALPMAAGAEDRLLVAARATSPALRPAPPIVESPEQPTSVPPERRPRRGAPVGPRRWVAAAAVAAVLAVLGGFVGYSVAPKGGSFHAVAFPATGGTQLAVVYQSGSSKAVVVGTNLPAPPEGKTYELWYQPAPNAPMHPAGTFEPRDGRVVADATVAKDGFIVLAVSVEPDGGSPAPTSNPVYVAAV